MAIYDPGTSITSVNDSSVPVDMCDYAGSVCAIVNEQSVRKGKPAFGTCGQRFNTGAYGAIYKGQQLCGALVNGMSTVWGPESGYPSGTGFVIGKTLIATANHVVEDVAPQKPESLRVVFGFKLSRQLTPTTNEIQIFEVAGIYMYNVLRDWAVLELRKSVGAEHPPLPLANEVETNRLVNGAQLAMIGHPFGQPMQYSTGVFEGSEHFGELNAKIAGFTGNSGSPVFALGRLGKVVGIYREHNHREDFEKTSQNGRSCFRYKHVPMEVQEHDTLVRMAAVEEALRLRHHVPNIGLE